MVDAPESRSRQLKVADLKRQIALGIYETPEKIEAAIDLFLDREETRNQGSSENKSAAPHRPK